MEIFILFEELQVEYYNADSIAQFQVSFISELNLVLIRAGWQIFGSLHMIDQFSSLYVTEV
jgi:hypothetical protein